MAKPKIPTRHRKASENGAGHRLRAVRVDRGQLGVLGFGHRARRGTAGLVLSLDVLAAPDLGPLDCGAHDRLWFGAPSEHVQPPKSPSRAGRLGDVLGSHLDVHFWHRLDPR